MKLTRNKIFFGILGLSIIANLLAYFNVQEFSLGAIFSFIFLTAVPGLLIMLMLKVRETDFWEYLVYMVGLSIAFLMFGGLLANWLLPLAGILNPLSFVPISGSLFLLMLVIGLVAYFRNKDLSCEVKYPNMPTVNWYLAVIALLFPILSVMGAFSLNNNGSNIFTMIMLGGIALYVIFLVLGRKKLNENIYPYSIYFIATALLFMTSLRGWYITGHDIQQEYYVYQLTKANFHWSMALFQDAYNACLSLNILPTIYSTFLKINDVYIYKVIFQLIFPFSAVGAYLLFKRYVAKSVAYLSVFLFVSFPTFLNDLPFLNRQEIALLFFTSCMLVLFNKGITPRLKQIMFLAFSVGMAVSHYSTSYIAVALFSATYAVSLILRSKFLNKRIQNGNNHYNLTFIMTTGLFLFTFLWNTQATKTSGGLTRTIVQTWQNIGQSFSQDLKSTDVAYSIFNWKKIDTDKLFKDYVTEQIADVQNNNQNLYFDKNSYEKYPLQLISQETLPETVLGSLLSSIHLNPYFLNYYIRQISAKLIQLLLVLGFIALILKKYRLSSQLDVEYQILILVSICLLGIFTVLPILSIEYGTLRFFQQVLTVLALPTIIGCLWIFSFLTGGKRLYVTLAVFIIFFLSLSGFIPQLTGGFYPWLNLDNQGSYYDCLYTHKSEISSIGWLSKIYNSKDEIQSNDCTEPKVTAINGTNQNIYVSTALIPINLKKKSYVYLDFAETMNNIHTVSINNQTYSYELPIEFLNQNKDLIFNNGSSKIFK